MIAFWILAGLAAAVTVAIFGNALFAGRGNVTATAEYDMQVYRDQLKELERDVARGVIGEGDAQRAKVEISRRLLDADRKAQAGEASANAPKAVTISAIAASAALIAGGGYAVYSEIGAPGYADMPLETRIAEAAEIRDTRPSQAEVEADLSPWAGPPANAPADYLDLVEKLRTTVAEHPDDLQGQMLLSTHESALGNYRAAHAAMARVLELKGDTATAGDYAQYADLLVLSAEGYVSPEAEVAITKALGLDPREPVSRFYAGLMNAQIGRPDLAFRIWRDLLESSDPSEPWVEPIMGQIGRIAAMAGVDYTPPAMQPTAPGPSAADIAAAQDMTPEERAEMVNGMVARLMDRLATQGGPATDWARLIGALGVQGDMDRASAIWGEAQAVFASRPDDLALINQAAANAGLTEAAPFAPAAPGTGAPAMSGPSAEDVDAAAEMSDEDRTAMIEGMVARLEDELMTNGGAPERWVQLFNVLGVLGAPDRAKAAWEKVQADYAGDAAALDQIRPAAQAVGATE